MVACARSVTAGRTRNPAQRSRRSLLIDTVESETVWLVYKLYLHGDCTWAARRPLTVSEIVIGGYLRFAGWLATGVMAVAAVIMCASGFF